MPTAVLHILVPLILMALFRDYFLTKKKKQFFPLHYVLIAGIAGLLPDIDIGAFYILHFFGFSISEVHRTFTHSIFLPIIFIIFFYAFAKIKLSELGRHKLTLSTICLMLSVGTIAHIILDAALSGSASLFYPFSTKLFGFDIISFLPPALRSLAIPTLEGILLVFWLVYLEVKHKISDFV